MAALERALKRVERERDRLRAQYDSSAAGYVTLDPAGCIVEANAGAAALLGTPPGTLRGTGFQDYVAPGSRPSFSDFMHRVLASDARQVCDVRLLDHRVIHAHLEGIASAHGRHRRRLVHLVLLDVSPEAYTRALLAAIVESSDDAIFTRDLDGTILTWNHAAERLFGYRSAEAIGRNISIITPPAQLAEAQELGARVSRGERVKQFETVRRRRDATDVRVSVNISPVRDAADRVTCVSVTVRDITDQWRNRLELEDRAARIQAIVDAAQEGIVAIDERGTIEEFNPAAERLFGYAAHEVIGRNVLLLMPPQDAGRHDAWIERYLQTGQGHVIGVGREVEGRRKDGQAVTVALAIREMTVGGRRKFVGTLHDLSARRRAEARSRDLEAYSRAILDALATPLCVLDANGNITSVNRAWRECSHAVAASNALLRGEDNYLDACNRASGPGAEGASEVAAAIRAALRGEPSRFSIEYPCETGDGSRWWVATGMGFDVAGARHVVIGHMDITERKASELALRERLAMQAQLEGIAATAPGVLCAFRMQPDGTLSMPFAAAGIEDIYGLAPEAVRSDASSVWARIAPQDTERVTAGIRASADAMAPWQDEWRVRHPTRGELWVEGRAIPQREPDGSILWHGFVHDVTERRRMQSALVDSERRYRDLSTRLQSLIEDERTRIAREIHDELGARLTRVKMDASWAARLAAERGQSCNEQFTALTHEIDVTIETVRRIATRLRPSVLDHLGLCAAIEGEAQEFSRRTNIACRLSLTEPSVAPGSDVETALFRILQEALTNVARHSGAKSVRVTLRGDKNHVLLRITDDGSGFAPEHTGRRSSLGLLGMSERARALGGTVAFNRTRAGGTRVSASIPLRERLSDAQAR